MVRMRLLAWLGLSLPLVALAADSKPPWQRLLGGDDAKKAAGLQQRVEKLEASDQYTEAIGRKEELLALRTKVQGADHWETVNEKWALTALKKVAKLPAEQRAGWRQAVRAHAEAIRLEQQARYGQALPLKQEYVKWCRQVLGEDHRDTATSYNDLAINLNAQGKYAEAGPLHHKALDIHRKTLGEEHPETASSYNNVAANLWFQGKYAEAGPLFRKALDIWRKTKGEDHSDTARGYNNLAEDLRLQGKYAEAGPLFQKALDIKRKLLGEEHPDTATSYSSLAVNLGDQGKYAEAGPLHHKALDIHRKILGEEHPNTAKSYNNLAANLCGQGKYEEAVPLYQKALDITRKVLGEEHPETARQYNNLAISLQPQGKYAEMEPLLRNALDICRKVLGEDHPSTARGYGNLAGVLDAQRKYAEAGQLYQKALELDRKVLGENHPNTAQSYHDVASNLQHQGQYEKAGPLYRKALDIRRKLLGENHPKTASGYFDVALNLQHQGQYAASLATVEIAARAYESRRLDAADTGLQRAAFGVQSTPCFLLILARYRAGRTADAWAAWEADLARGLLDDMTHRQGVTLTPAEQQQRDELQTKRTPLGNRILALVRRPQRTASEEEELKRLLRQRQELDTSLADLAVSLNKREVATLDRLQSTLPADAALVTWVDLPAQFGALRERWGCVVRPTGEPTWQSLPGSAAQGKWTPEDDELPAQFRKALAESAPAAQVDALAKRLHAQRLAPLANHLAGVKRLLVAAVDEMAGVPIEALTDQYTVSYTPSGTYLARLKERPPPRSKRLLAVGDPVFPPTKTATPPAALPPGGLLITQVLPGGNAAKARLQAGDVLVAYAGERLTSAEQLGKLADAKAAEKSVAVRLWREGLETLAERELVSGRLDVVLAKEPAREAITARRQTDRMLTRLSRDDDFAELPGTQVEIARLAELFDSRSVTTLTRADASEQRLDQLRRAGELRQYRYLHLATHGQANNVRAFDSALILSRPMKPPEPRAGEPYLDGRLTAAEVLEYWQLDAELVTLSACESGLGRQGGGEGLLGFAQSFLLAGSRSVCVSLWKVDDMATALLMDRFYRNLLGKREGLKESMGKAAALAEAKRWLRDLPRDQALKRMSQLSNGVARAKNRPALPLLPASPKDAPGIGEDRPYAHPRYWAAFILIGAPE